MDHGGWYDRQNTFRLMADCLFVAAMGPPGGGRNNVTSRYTRHFNMVSIVDFDDAPLKSIFSSILDWALATRGFPANIKVRVRCAPPSALCNSPCTTQCSLQQAAAMIAQALRLCIMLS